MLGSIERFIGILLEHTSGDLPIWLAPIQVNIIPISDKHIDYSRKLSNLLLNEDIRVKIDESNERLGQKIRNSELEKVPMMIIIGDKEVESKSGSVRIRKHGDIGSLSEKEIIKKILSI